MILFSFNGFFAARGSASLTSADTGCEATVRANSNRYPAHGSVGVRRPREPHADPPQEGRSRSHLAVEPSSQVQQQQPVGAGSQDCACAGRRRRGTRRAGRTRPGQGLQDGAELLPGRHGWPESRAGAGVASLPPSCVGLRGWLWPRCEFKLPNPGRWGALCRAFTQIRSNHSSPSATTSAHSTLAPDAYTFHCFSSSSGPSL